jgi:hypothetical protein
MDIFGLVVVVVSVLAAAVSVLAYARADRLYERIGRTGALWFDKDEGLSPDASELIQQEVEQTLAAISARRGQQPRRAPGPE